MLYPQTLIISDEEWCGVCLSVHSGRPESSLSHLLRDPEPQFLRTGIEGAHGSYLLERWGEWGWVVQSSVARPGRGCIDMEGVLNEGPLIELMKSVLWAPRTGF